MEMGDSLARLNAVLNASSTLFLLVGFAAIRRKKIPAHRFCMVTAFGLSLLFLISYLTRFYLTGVHRFPHGGWLKTTYLTILFSHTTLAAMTPFLVIRTLYLAVRERFEAHKKIARVAYPIWLYVSITGVVVYLMLYHL